MKLVSISRTVRWRIHKEIPLMIDFPSIPGWRFLNPLAYFSFYRKSEAKKYLHRPLNHGVCDDHAIITTPPCFIAPEDYFPSDPEPRYITPDDPFYPVPDNLTSFLLKLRFLSNQFDLSAGYHDISGHPIEQVPDPYFPSESEGSDGYLWDHYLNTSVTINNVEETSNMPVSFTPPMHDTIILDAMDAINDLDYRKAILYAAISVDVLASLKLEGAYRSAIQSYPPDPDLRISSFPHQGGGTSIKDPIFEILSERQGISVLLHQLPLYLMRKSLLLDDNDLYQRAIILYKTRSKIVHLGEPPYDQQVELLPIDQDGASEAIHCAIDVFEWFGESYEYFVPAGSDLRKVSRQVDPMLE